VTMHQVDATSRATALPVPDAPALPLADLVAAVASYQARERQAATEHLAIGDASVQRVRAAVPQILEDFRRKLIAVNDDPDLSPVGRARQRATLQEEQKAALAALAPHLRDATVRAQTFGVVDPPTEADRRELTEIIRQRGELAPRFLLPVLAERLKAASTTGVGVGTFRALLPFLKSWFETDAALQGNADLWNLIACVEGVTPEGERTGGLTVDRNSLYAEARLREVSEVQYLLNEVVTRPDSMSYAAWGVTPPPEPPINRAAVQAASMGPLEGALLAQGATI